MSFRLRGGAPKNMRQGIYWVQRHQADVRAAQRADAAVQRRLARDEIRIVSAAKRQQEIAIKRCKIERAMESYFDKHGTFQTTEKARDQLLSAVDKYRQINAELGSALSCKGADVGRLATAAKRAIILAAKINGQSVVWNSADKQLWVDGNRIM